MKRTTTKKLRRTASSAADAPAGVPDTTLSVREAFGIASELRCPAFSMPTDLVPAVDEGYCFDPGTTFAILAGFMHNRRVLVQGYHGTGKSTHIEQVAARLNWPCVRINLDGHVSRIDLIGKDVITLRDGKQVVEFREGVLPWALQRPVALVLDEYDAGRPDVMFVLQRVLESEGKIVLLDQSRVLTPHSAFRLFATANTVGLGDASGLYSGTQPINQGQMDRWQIVATLNYLAPETECAIVLAHTPGFNDGAGRELIGRMVTLAGLTRVTFMSGELSTLMSPRTVINWAQNVEIFGSVERAFLLSFMNKCDDAERTTVAELYQRCFGVDVQTSAATS
jgi:cobaltochelatase CobS